MIEIFAVMMLADHNAKKAAERGSEPRPYRTITYVLWFICEIIGFIAGILMTGDIVGAYFFALLAGCAGGLISYLAALNCSPVNHSQIQNSPSEGAAPLYIPCILSVTRLSSAAGAAAVYNVWLNGQLIGNLGDGESVQVTSNLAQNIITAKDSSGNELRPLYFSVPSGGNAWICFDTQRFLPENSGGITVIRDTANSLMMQDQNMHQYPGTGSSGNENNPQMSGMTAYSQPVFGQSPSADISADPLRTVWLLAALNIFMLTGGACLASSSASELTAAGFFTVSFSAVLGVCTYIFQHDELKYKMLAAGGLVVSSAVRSLSYLVIPTVFYDIDLLQSYTIINTINNYDFFGNLSEALVLSLIAATAALFISSVHKGNINQKTMAAAAASCVLSVIYSIFRIRMMDFGSSPVYPLSTVIIQIIVGGAALAGFAAAAYLLGSFGNKRLEVRGSSKIWCIFCAAVSFICLAANLADEYYFSVSLIILQAAGIAGYILMIKQKRIGYPVVLCSSLLSLALLGRVLQSFQITFTVGWLELLSVINPLVCWMLIRNEWNEADAPYLQNAPDSFPQFSHKQPPMPVQRSKYDGFYALCAVINSLTGGMFFITAMFTFSFSQVQSYVPYYLGLTGACLLALAFLVFRHCFSRTFRLHKAVLVIQTLAAGAMTLVLISFFSMIT